jgi:hypothetical protein
MPLSLQDKGSEHLGRCGNVKCNELLRYLSEYIDQDLDENLRREAEEHLSLCDNCHVVLDTTLKTIYLYRENRCEELPPEINQALYQRLETALSMNPGADPGNRINPSS